MGSTIQQAKQELVRSTIWDAAIDLFAEQGFDQTTVDQIAEAAGVSRRSFFRYFASKDDVMGQAIVAYGTALCEAIAAAPATYSPMEVMRDAVLRVAAAAAAHPRTRPIIRISKTSTAARQAQLSRIGEVEDRVAAAFAARWKGTRAGKVKPRLLASLTFSILDVTFRSWFEARNAQIGITAEEVMQTLLGLVREDER